MGKEKSRSVQRTGIAFQNFILFSFMSLARHKSLSRKFRKHYLANFARFSGILMPSLSAWALLMTGLNSFWDAMGIS